MLLSLVSLAMMLLAVETQVSDSCVSISVISVVVLLVKFVAGYSLMFVCSVNKSFVGRR